MNQMKPTNTSVYCVFTNNTYNFFASSKTAKAFAEEAGQHVVFKVDHMSSQAPDSLRHAVLAAICYKDFRHGCIGHA